MKAHLMTDARKALANDCERYAKIIEGIVVVDNDWQPGDPERREPRETLLKAAAYLRSPLPGTREEVAREIPKHIFMDQSFDECDAAEQKAFLRCADAILALPPAPERDAKLDYGQWQVTIHTILREELRTPSNTTIYFGDSITRIFDFASTFLMPEREAMREILDKVEAEARRYAEMYKPHSDGRNTFVIFADWVAALASHDKTEG